ncbi:MAG: hypothetical protein PHP17_04785 [Candidatus Omnitrophica bacterium]|nr:hypothetical protein [Candidatus Omnitrophota bacterium]
MAIRLKVFLVLLFLFYLICFAKGAVVFAQSFVDNGCGGKQEAENAAPAGIPACSQLWKGNILVLDCDIYENCEAKIESYGYSMDGDTINLKYKAHVLGAPANCNCNHKVIYEIDGLVRKPYTVIFENIKAIKFKKQKTTKEAL